MPSTLSAFPRNCLFKSAIAGSATEGLLGSVATEVVRLCDVPVTLV